jgi:phosphoserine aminotransferase
VSLLPGFIAEAGSHFSASIEECNANTLKSLKLNKKELYYNSLPDDSIMMRRRNYEGVSVFPNPTSSGVTIKYNVETLQGTAILTLLDSSGQLIKRGNNGYTFNLEHICIILI